MTVRTVSRERESAPLLVETANQLHALLGDLARAGRVAVDIESNGMFAYRGRVCTMQIAWIDEPGTTRVAIVDTLAVGVKPLGPLLESPFVVKVIHDLAFDARVLHFEGVDLRAVRDTSVAASYLGKPATGLASLLLSELGVVVDKEMQNSDWARRPLSNESVAYLAGDVRSLLSLDTRLAGQVREADIEDEVATETAYRLIDALETATEVRPPHLRIRGHDRLDGMARRILEAIAVVREQAAEQRDLPPQRIIADKLLLAVASARPTNEHELSQFRSLKRLPDGMRDQLLDAIRDAVKLGPARKLEVSGVPSHQEVAMRRAIEKRLQTWRRSEAERRGITEQVVLPSHCIRYLASGLMVDPDAIAAMPGLGPARANRYASSLALMIRDLTEHA